MKGFALSVDAADGSSGDLVDTFVSASTSLANLVGCSTARRELRMQTQMMMDLTTLASDDIAGVDMYVEGRLDPAAPWSMLQSVLARAPGSVTNWSSMAGSNGFHPAATEVRLRAVVTKNGASSTYHAFSLFGRAIPAW